MKCMLFDVRIDSDNTIILEMSINFEHISQSPINRLF